MRKIFFSSKAASEYYVEYLKANPTKAAKAKFIDFIVFKLVIIEV